jgi:hypothetical protein
MKITITKKGEQVLEEFNHHNISNTSDDLKRKSITIIDGDFITPIINRQASVYKSNIV